MTETEFNTLVDATLARIEDALEACGLDLEFETVGGILTIEFEDGSKVIVNRQTPNRELWVAAKSGGFHFRFARDERPGAAPGDGAWTDTRGGKPLAALLEEVVSKQAGARANLSL